MKEEKISVAMLVNKVKLQASVELYSLFCFIMRIFRIISRERHSSASDHQTESKF